MFLLGTRSVPVGFVAPLKTPSQAQHLASNVDFLEAPCLCLSNSYSRWTLGQGLLLQLLLLRSCDCFFTPGGAHLFPRGATYALLFSASVCPSVSLGVIFSWAQEASRTARIITLLPTCCMKYNVYSPCYIYELNAATSS